jgi:hypothetical protein
MNAQARESHSGPGMAPSFLTERPAAHAAGPSVPSAPRGASQPYSRNSDVPLPKCPADREKTGRITRISDCDGCCLVDSKALFHFIGANPRIAGQQYDKLVEDRDKRRFHSVVGQPLSFGCRKQGAHICKETRIDKLREPALPRHAKSASLLSQDTGRRTPPPALFAPHGMPSQAVPDSDDGRARPRTRTAHQALRSSSAEPSSSRARRDQLFTVPSGASSSAAISG